jgi:hypothetical protein
MLHLDGAAYEPNHLKVAGATGVKASFVASRIEIRL